MFTCLWLATVLLMRLNGKQVDPMMFVVLTVLALLEFVVLIEWLLCEDRR